MCQLDEKKNSFLAASLDILLIAFLGEFSEIDVKRVQNPKATIRRCSTKQVLLKILHLCWSLFCNKIQAKPVIVLKERLQYKCFPMNFTKSVRTSIL